MASINEWKDLFKNNTEELISIHSDEDGTGEVLKYFNSDGILKEKDLLLSFCKSLLMILKTYLLVIKIYT